MEGFWQVQVYVFFSCKVKNYCVSKNYEIIILQSKNILKENLIVASQVKMLLLKIEINFALQNMPCTFNLSYSS